MRNFLVLMLLISFSLPTLGQTKAEKKLDKLYLEVENAFVKKNNQVALKKLDEAETLINEEFPDNNRLQLDLNAMRILVAERVGDLKWLQSLYETERNMIAELAGKENVLYAENTMNLASLQQRLGNFQESEQLFLEAEPIYRKEHEGTLTLAVFLREYGNLLFYLGQYDKAREIFEENLNHYEQTLVEESIPTSIGLNNLGVIELETGNTEKSITYLKRAYNGRTKSGYKDESFGSICFNLGLAYIALNELDSAQKIINQSLKIHQKVSGKSNANYGATLGGLARVQQLKGNLKKAQAHYEEAIQVIENVLGNRHPRYIQLNSRMAKLLDELGDQAGALNYHQKTMDNVYWLIKDVFPGLSESEQANFYYSIQSLIDRFYEFALNHPSPESMGQLFDAQLHLKSLFLRNSQLLTRKAEQLNPEMKTEFLELMDMKKEFSKMLKTGTKGALDSLALAINKKEKTISRQMELMRLLNPEISWQKVQSALNPGDVVIEIIRSDLKYYGLILSKGVNAPELIELGETTQMEGSALEAYRNAIKFKLDDNNSFEIYGKPIFNHPRVTSSQKIYLSAEGAYHFINLNGLQDQDGKYIIETKNIIRISSAVDLLNVSSSYDQTSIALFGSPSFDLKTTSTNNSNDHWTRALRGTVLAPLPGTKEETKSIHSTMTSSGFQALVYLDEEASEEAVKAVKSPRVLHIATHGFFLKPEITEITEKNFLGIESLADFEHPLRSSGLMFSGSQQTIQGESIGEEDGILTSFETSLLDLSKTQLAVLSACETGLGELQNGEGVFGLQRGLTMAGAQNLIMSLWKVDDEATQRLMTQFYQNYANGSSIKESLRSAQMSIRKEYPHPYYWASFVCLGVE